MLKKALIASILLVTLAAPLPAQQVYTSIPSGGPIDAGGGDFFYWSLALDGPLMTLTLTYYGPDFPTPLVVTMKENGLVTITPLYRDVMPPDFGTSKPMAPAPIPGEELP